MAASVTSLGATPSFSNASITTSPFSCEPCTSMQIFDVWRGGWAANDSMPPLRFLQAVVDPNNNITSMSTECNPIVLPAYTGNSECASVTLNDNCDIVCVAYGGRQSSGATPYTITMTGTTGQHLQFNGKYSIQGGVSTTDSAGQYICNTTGTVNQPTLTYNGPVVETDFTNAAGEAMGMIMLPELTSLYPDEPLFSQCSLIQAGPPQVALTAANQIVLPTRTLPLTRNPGPTTPVNSTFSCGPCLSMQVHEDWSGYWTANASLPAIRTIQEIVDPNKNTTSTSTFCNSAAFSAAPKTDYDLWGECHELRLDDDCNLVCVDDKNRDDAFFTITATEASGNYLQFGGPTFRIAGEYATTDNNGKSICLTGGDGTLKLPLYTYSGPLNRRPLVVVGSTTLPNPGLGAEAPDLASVYPDEPAFKQCRYLQTNPPPVFLTPVNQIKLPARTLPISSNAATTTPISPSTSPTTSPQPTGGIVVPSPTTTERGPTTTEEPLREETSEAFPPPPPRTGAAAQPDDSPAPSPEGNPSASETPRTSAGSALGTTAPSANPALSPSQGQTGVSADPSSPSDDGGQQRPEPARPTANIHDSADDNDPPPNTDSSNTTQPAGNLPIEPVTVHGPGSSITQIPGLPESSPPNNEDTPEVIVGGSTTIVAGGGVAVGSGTTFSLLPSSGGIVAVADGSTSTLSLPTAIAGVGADSAPPVLAVPGTTPHGVVVGGSTTIIAGGGVAVGSGTTFSVLPSTGGVIAIAGGRTSTLPLPTDSPSVEGNNVVQPATNAAQGFVLPGLTLSEGSEAIVVRGTSFSALPSGSGIVAISEGGSTTLQPSQLSEFGISTAAGNPDAFVLPSQTLAAGGSNVVVSGTTYSALPGGNGINVVLDGQTSVIVASEASTISGIGSISLVNSATVGFVLDGSVTVLPGGVDATISGTVYTALPSGFGVLASSDSDDLAAYIEHGISGDTNDDGESYIVGLDNPPAAGLATTVSAVVYSVLPSGSGILVVANGHSKTIEFGPTGGSSDGDGAFPTASGEAKAGETVTPFTGGSLSVEAGGLSSWVWVLYLFVLGIEGMRLVL